MTYDALENSTDGGLKASLYLAEYGPGEEDYFAYTDFTSAITFQGIVYEPVAIGREPLTASGSLDQKPFTVDIAPNAGLAEYIGNRTPDHEIRLTIRVGHVADEDQEYLAVWAGKITGAKRRTCSLNSVVSRSWPHCAGRVSSVSINGRAAGLFTNRIATRSEPSVVRPFR